MKTLKLFLILLGVLCVLAVNSPAQTNLDQVPDHIPPATITGALTELKDAIFSNNTNWIAETHFLYAPALHDRFGGGIGYFYQVNNYVLTGVRLDWVDGGFWMPSGNATLQLPLHPFTHFPFLPSLIKNAQVTPFAYAGIGIPVSGAKIGSVTVPGSLRDNNGEATAILGQGLALRIYAPTTDAWNISLAGDRETWSGFPGVQYRFALLFHGHVPEGLIK